VRRRSKSGFSLTWCQAAVALFPALESEA